MRHLGLAAGANGGNQAVKGAQRRVVVDDPARLLVLLDALDLDAELGVLVQVVALPELLDLADDLLAVGIAALPLDGGVEAVHERVDLEARRVVDSLHNIYQ